MCEFTNPKFIDHNVGDAQLQKQIEDVVLRLLENDPDHYLGNGNIEMMVESLVSDAIKSLEAKQYIRENPLGVYTLVMPPIKVTPPEPHDPWKNNPKAHPMKHPGSE